MKVAGTPLTGVRMGSRAVLRDARGWFSEAWNIHRPGPEDGARFVQDNVAASSRGVLRGIHFQWPEPQGKLVTVLAGEIFDVIVDLRRGSPQFGRWMGVLLTESGGEQVFIPEGFGHGYAVTSDQALVHYKATAPYRPACERTVAWDDPDLAIVWPVTDPIISSKDRAGTPLGQMPPDHLPEFHR